MADRGDFCSIQLVAQQGTLLGSGLEMTVGVGSGSGEGRHAPGPGPVATHSVVTGASSGGLVRGGQQTDQLVRLIVPGSPSDRVQGLVSGQMMHMMHWVS